MKHQWLISLKIRNFEVNEHSRVCSKHFSNNPLKTCIPSLLKSKHSRDTNTSKQARLSSTTQTLTSHKLKSIKRQLKAIEAVNHDHTYATSYSMSIDKLKTKIIILKKANKKKWKTISMVIFILLYLLF